MMTLGDFTESVYLRERALRPNSARQIRMSVQLFAEFIGKDISIAELDHHLLNDWAENNPREWAPKTMKRRVADVLAVWTYAYAIGETENQPNRLRIRHIRIPRQLPVAWTIDDLQAMLDASNRFDRYLHNGVPQFALLRAMINVGFYSALRASDLMRVRRHELSSSGLGVAQEKKHGSEVFVVIPQWVIDEIDETYPRTVVEVFAWPHSKVSFYDLWHRMLRVAGLPCGKREGLQKLRRTAVTYGELAQTGYGSRLAGHSPGSAVTYRSYADPRVLQAKSPVSLPDIRARKAL